jgi:hypothetical protein
MREKMILLERSIQNDLRAIEQIYTQLTESPLTSDPSEENLIIMSYRLHNLYSAFENILKNIAAAFENSLDDKSQWHSQLLQRMKLDLTPVRPAVLDDEMYDKLDELRRFRHLFRTNYAVRLDSRRLQLVLDKALELKSVYKQQVSNFLVFLQQLT